MTDPTIPSDDDLEDEDPVLLPFEWERVPVSVIAPGGYSSLRSQCNWTCVLPDERPIRLDTLHQWHTYGGVLAGLPYGPVSHERHIQEAVEIAESIFHVDRHYVFVSMPRLYLSRIRRAPGSSGLPEEDIAFLPAVACAALLRSSTPEGLFYLGESWAVAVWYQQSFGPPEGGFVTEQLRKIPWDDCCIEWEG